MTEVLKAHQNLLGKVRQGKRTDFVVQTLRKEVAKGEIHVGFGVFSNVQNSMLQVDADSDEQIQHQLHFTFHRMMDDRYNDGKSSRMTRPHIE